jgi:hypothetical protein
MQRGDAPVHLARQMKCDTVKLTACDVSSLRRTLATCTEQASKKKRQRKIDKRNIPINQQQQQQKFQRLLEWVVSSSCSEAVKLGV